MGVRAGTINIHQPLDPPQIPQLIVLLQGLPQSTALVLQDYQQDQLLLQIL